MKETMTLFQEDTPSGSGSYRQSGSEDQLSLLLLLDGYEGPIDLLLSLAREQKIDLRQIAILPLAEQYLDYIQRARALDLEIAADYLVMAAWLAYLKSRLLLPDPDPEEENEAALMADALKFQLARLEAMQNAGKALMALPQLGKQRFSRGQTETFAETTTVSWNATLFDLLQAYGSITTAKSAATLTIEATRLFTVEDAVKRLSHLLERSPGWSVLQSFMPPGVNTQMDHRSALAAHFVASLELVRDGTVKLRQDSRFGPIWLASAKRSVGQ